MEKDSTTFFPFLGCWFPSLERQRVGSKQDEREFSWGFRHKAGLTGDLSALSPLRFLFLRPKRKKKRYLLALESYTNHHHRRNSTLLWTRTLPLEGMSENSKIQCFKCKQQPTCRPSPSHILWFYGPQFSSVQSLSRVRLLATPWIAAHQASLSITSSRSSLDRKSVV